MNQIAATPLYGRSDGVECFFPVAPVFAGDAGAAGGNSSASHPTSVVLVGVGDGIFLPMKFIPFHGVNNVK